MIVGPMIVGVSEESRSKRPMVVRGGVSEEVPHIPISPGGIAGHIRNLCVESSDSGHEGFLHAK